MIDYNLSGYVMLYNLYIGYVGMMGILRGCV